VRAIHFDIQQELKGERYAVPIVVYLLTFFILGKTAATHLLLQSVLAQVLFKAIMYNTHYGLTRSMKANDGRKYLSWYDDGYCLNSVLYNIGVHHYHHRTPDNASKGIGNLRMLVPIPWTLASILVPEGFITLANKSVKKIYGGVTELPKASWIKRALLSTVTAVVWGTVLKTYTLHYALPSFGVSLAA
jgi:hypothetical protein